MKPDFRLFCLKNSINRNTMKIKNLLCVLILALVAVSCVNPTENGLIVGGYSLNLSQETLDKRDEFLNKAVPKEIVITPTK